MPLQVRLNELVDYLDAQRAALLRTAAALPAGRWNERPAPDRWSVAELLEHVSMVERSCTRAIAKRLGESRAEGVGRETASTSVLGALEGAGLTDRSRKLTAPDRALPTGGLSPDEALGALAASHAELMQVVQDADGLALGEIKLANKVLGDIDLYQWILFVGQHEERHLAQLAEITGQLASAAR